MSWLQSLSTVILELKKMKSLTVSTLSPSISHEIMGLEAMIFIFWMLSFEQAFSVSYFTFAKRLFNSSSLSTIKVVSSAYLKLLIFLPTVLIPVCESSSLAFPMIYSGYKLNNQGGNIQPWDTPFPIWNQSIVSCLLVTVDCCTAYRFLRRQVRWSSTPISLRVFHRLLWSTQSDFSIVNEADVDFCCCCCCYFNSLALSMIQRMLAIWSLVPLPFLNPVCTSGSSQLTDCWSLAWGILNIILLACEMRAIVW